MPGTRLVSRTAGRRSRIRRVGAKAPRVRCIWRICAIPTATSCARCIGCRRKVGALKGSYSHLIALCVRRGETPNLSYPLRPRGGEGQVAITLRGLTWRVFGIARAPLQERPEHGAKILAAVGQQIFRARRMLLVEAPFDDPRFFE